VLLSCLYPAVVAAATVRLNLLPHASSRSGQHNELEGVDDWINVLQSLQLPFALFPLLHFTSSRAIMGDFASGRITTGLGWLLACVVVGVNTYLIVITFQDTGGEWYLTLTAVLIMVPYALFSLYLAIAPLFRWSKVSRSQAVEKGVSLIFISFSTLTAALHTCPSPSCDKFIILSTRHRWLKS
jgi:hypothetical protein